MDQFSGEHVAAMIAMVLLAAALVIAARRGGRRRAEPAARILAVLILAAYVAEHATYIVRGTWTVSANLPLHLSDAVTLVAVAALLRPQARLLVEVLYFWAFSASLQAVVTPGVGRPFPDVLYFTYFATHAGVIVAASLLVFGCRRLPRRGAVARVYAITAALAALAGAASIVTGGNYMFLREPPPRASLLDLMGPWPWYIVGGAALGLVMFALLAGLAALAERRPAPR